MSASIGPWTVPLAVAELPDEGAHFELDADSPTRERIARHAGLRALTKLQASFDIVRHGTGVKLAGEVRGEVGQTCIVTLDPIDNMVVETVDLIFSPDAAGDSAPRRRSKGPHGRKELDEPLVGGVIDLGAVATEFLMLGLNPYPRKPDTQFRAPPVEAASQPNPFAALNALKKR